MAVLSMTGFGEARVSDGGLELAVEIKSVNHRFLDVVTRLPAGYQRLEPEISRIVRSRLNRGRVEVTVSRSEIGDPLYQLRFNRDLFEKYLAILKEASTSAGVAEQNMLASAVVTILNKREVLELAPMESSADGEQQLLENAVNEAVTKLIEMRTNEGALLEQELRGHLQNLEQNVAEIQKKAEAAPLDFKSRLTARLERVSPGVEVDPERLSQEVAILAERVDVTEELARLGSHFVQFKKALSDGDGGRKLEFLLQEFGREINTVGSKAQNSEVTALVVEAKSLIEKLREQVANIE